MATKEITLTHTIIFDNAPITLSATKEHKTPAIQFNSNLFYFKNSLADTTFLMNIESIK